MNAQQATPKIRWRRILLAFALGTPLITFPIWHRLLFPDFWSDTRCVFLDAGGDVRMAQGAVCDGVDQ